MTNMYDVVVARTRRTTIPIEFRKNYKIDEGSVLEVLDTGQIVLLKPNVSFFDMAGADAKAKETKDKRNQNALG